MEELIMDNKIIETNENTVTEPVVQVETPVVEETKPEVETKTEPTKTQLLRDLSKEYGLDLFSKEGLAAFKEFQDSKKTEQEKLQDQLNSLKEKETEFKSKEESYQAKIAALELDISEDKLNDAIALAKINMTDGQTIKEGLAAVKAKYGDTFSKVKGTKTEVVIGTQQNQEDAGHIEVDPVVARLTKAGKIK
jgi:hypothetical protein